MSNGFKTWRLYVKHLIKTHPEKSLKWLLTVYHKKHPEKYKEFQKNPKTTL